MSWWVMFWPHKPADQRLDPGTHITERQIWQLPIISALGEDPPQEAAS